MKKILFLCVANSARSQMAEGLARSLLGDLFEVESAGSEPSGKVNPFAIEVMNEIGLNISAHQSKSWNALPDVFMRNLDFVVTLCAEEICPVLATQARKLHWGLPDPASAGKTEQERREAFRLTRDEIQKRLIEFRKTMNEGGK